MRRNGFASNFARLVEAHGGLDALGGPDRDLDILRVEPGGNRLILRIEHLGPSPFKAGMVLVSATHYLEAWEAEEKLTADPDVLFDLDPDNWLTGHWTPIQLMSDSLGFAMQARWIDENTGNVFSNMRESKYLRHFISDWNKRIKEQGYLDDKARVVSNGSIVMSPPKAALAIVKARARNDSKKTRKGPALRIVG
jgi:hypothetical protein